MSLGFRYTTSCIHRSESYSKVAQLHGKLIYLWQAWRGQHFFHTFEKSLRGRKRTSRNCCITRVGILFVCVCWTARMRPVWGCWQCYEEWSYWASPSGSWTLAWALGPWSFGPPRRDGWLKDDSLQRRSGETTIRTQTKATVTRRVFKQNSPQSKFRKYPYYGVALWVKDLSSCLHFSVYLSRFCIHVSLKTGSLFTRALNTPFLKLLLSIQRQAVAEVIIKNFEYPLLSVTGLFMWRTVNRQIFCLLHLRRPSRWQLAAN